MASSEDPLVKVAARKTASKPHARDTGCIIALLVVLGLSCLLLYLMSSPTPFGLDFGFGPELPTNSAVVKHFDNHKEEFEKLRDMFMADAAQGRLVFIRLDDPQYSDYDRIEDRSKPPLSPDRFHAYVQIFKRLDLKAGSFDSEHTLRLILGFHAGLLNAGPLCKGYILSSKSGPPDYHKAGQWEILDDFADGCADTMGIRSSDADTPVENATVRH